MNKTISINIAGFVFNIEEHAYEQLNQYLKSVKRNFSNEEEREEIMDDIEARIAELFREKISVNKEVIIESDVEDVINVMGKPEDYAADDLDDEETTKSEEQTFDQVPNDKKLFRDEDNAMLGGVCAGLGQFFNLDPTLIRAIFIILTILGGSGILVYILLLIFVPEAKTTAEKLQMRGQSITLDSIKQHAKDFKNDIKDKAKSAHIKHTFQKTVHRGAQATSNFAKAFSKLFGLVFTIGGIFALFMLITIFFGDSGLIPIVGSDQIENLPTLIEIIYPGSFQHSIIFIAIIIVTIIPIISILATGLKLLFNYKQNFKQIAIGFTLIWIIAIGTLVITGIELGMNFRNENEIEYDYTNYNDSTDVLYVNVMEDQIFSNHIEYDDVWNYTELIKVEEENIYLGYPELRIVEKDDSSNFDITLFKRSSGLSMQDAIDKAESISYNIDITENQLSLAPYFIIKKEDKLRDQRAIIEIQVPQGKRIVFGDNIDRIRTRINQDNYYNCKEYFRLENTIWTSQTRGLKSDQCDEYEED